MLHVSDLSVRYRSADGAEHTALENVTLEVAPGEVVGVMGESGCGKTTLCLAILGLLPVSARVTRGSICWNDRDLLHINEREFQNVRGAEISLIFQEPALALNPVMRAGKQIAAVLRAHSVRGRAIRERVEALLADVQLAPTDKVFQAYPHELSGGQQQRLAIAQALACRPGLVVADEPTASLDLTTQAEIIELLRGLRNDYDTSFLVVSHSPAVLMALADRVVVLDGGRVVEQGTRHAIFNSLHERTARLLRPFSRAVPPEAR